MANNNIELELSVLGALITWGADELKSEAEELQADDFLTETVSELFKKGKADNWNKAILLSHISNEEKGVLLKSIETVISISTFSAEASRLREIASAERLRTDISNIMFTDKFSPESVQTLVEREKQRGGFGSIENKLAQVIEEYQNSFIKPSEVIKTGYSTIDSITSGLHTPSVCIVGARPSTGKTAFALNIMLNIARNKNKTLMFSLEMSTSMIIDRLLSARYQIRYEKFNDKYNEISKGEFEQCKKLLSWLEKGNMPIIDSVSNIEGIAAITRKLKPKFVVIDYAQIITTIQKFNSTREQINYISAECKRIAKENDCCVMLLSQLTRVGKEAPTMSDLKESGSLEADGDCIMLLHRPYVLDKGGSFAPEQTYLLIDKNKFGRCGKVDLCFQGEFQQLREITKREEQ